MIISGAVVIIVGLAGGLAVGSGFVAFLTVLGIVPRLTQLTKTKNYIKGYEFGLVLGATAGTWLSLSQPTLSLPNLLLIVIGLFGGIFFGSLAAALTEVLNVFPILAKRVGVHDHIKYLLMAIVLGKITGSLFHWLYFVNK